MDHALDQTVLGDAGEAMGSVRTGDGGGDPSGNGAAVAVPINFKELVVLTRRGGSFRILFFQWLLTDRCVCVTRHRFITVSYTHLTLPTIYPV